MNQDRQRQLAEAFQDELEKIAAVQHVLVTGLPGSGKTTEAERLSKELGLPLVSLDGVPNANTATARRFVRRKLNTPHVIEGTQLLGLRAGDTEGHEVVVLDEPKKVLIDRLVRRGWNDPSGKLLKGEKHRKTIEQQAYDDLLPALREFQKASRPELDKPPHERTMSSFTIRDMTQKDVERFELKHVDLSKPWAHKIAVSAEGDIVGFAAYSPGKKELTQLWVQPPYRRRGVATKLIESVGPIERLNVRHSNRAAQKLYGKRGLELSGEVASKRDGRPYSLVMKKRSGWVDGYTRKDGTRVRGYHRGKEKNASDPRLGACLQAALRDAKRYPNRSLIIGPPGNDYDTAHFWTENKKGRVFDRTSHLVPKGYKYEGRRVSARSVRKELSKKASDQVIALAFHDELEKLGFTPSLALKMMGARSPTVRKAGTFMARGLGTVADTTPTIAGATSKAVEGLSTAAQRRTATVVVKGKKRHLIRGKDGKLITPSKARQGIDIAAGQTKRFSPLFGELASVTV